MTDPLPEDQRLVEISSKAYEHPADRAATAALQSIPMLDQVVRKLIEFGYERALRQVFMGGSVKLGPDQLPDAWAAHRAALARLDIKEVPELYLTQFPVTNAAAIGSERPMVVINSRTVEVLDEQELRTVLGHEAGHILSDHVLYRTALMILLSVSGLGGCRCSPACRCWRSRSRCWSGSAPPSSPPTARPRSSTATRS